jgi:hypothetical protein
MIDRRRSAPLQLEKAEKLESGQVREGQVGASQVRACQCGAGQVRRCRCGAGQVGVKARQVRARQVKARQAIVPLTIVSDSLRGVISSEVADV